MRRANVQSCAHGTYDAAQGVTITATAVAGPAAVLDAITDVGGTYRVRNIVPGVPYDVHVQLGTPPLGRTLPPSRRVVVDGADAPGADFILIRPPSTCVVSGIVEAVPAHRKHLRLILSVASEPDAPLQSTPVGPGGFFEFSGVPRTTADRGLLVRLECTLPRHQWVYRLPEATVTSANPRVPRGALRFVAEPAAITTEVSRASAVPLLATVATVALALYADKVRCAAWLGSALASVSQLTQARRLWRPRKCHSRPCAAGGQPSQACSRPPARAATATVQGSAWSVAKVTVEMALYRKPCGAFTAAVEHPGTRPARRYHDAVETAPCRWAVGCTGRR